MAADLAVIDAAAARVDDRIQVLSRTTRAPARANLLCAEEVAKTHDAQVRSDDYNALKRAEALQKQVASIRLRQEQAVEVQRLLDLKLAQAAEASEAASDDAVRILEAGGVRRAAYIDDVRLRRDVVAPMPAVPSAGVTSGDDGGAAGVAFRRDAVADGGGSVVAARAANTGRVDARGFTVGRHSGPRPLLPSGVPVALSHYPESE
eukprot:jgi/Undpi1/3672/HiC_scaffold_16.g07042.m1